jgi:hypothetical protein
VKIRLLGTAEECDQAARVLTAVLDVVTVSEPYPDRGRSRLGRIYVEVRLTLNAPRPHRASVEQRDVLGSRSTAPTESCPAPNLPAAAWHAGAPARGAPGWRPVPSAWDLPGVPIEAPRPIGNHWLLRLIAAEERVRKRRKRLAEPLLADLLGNGLVRLFRHHQAEAPADEGVGAEAAPPQLLSRPSAEAW